MFRLALIFCVCNLAIGLELSKLFKGKSAFGEPSVATGKLLASMDPDKLTNPEELGDYLEGDILFPNSRNGLLSETFRWENGIIPYELTGSFSSQELDIISNAMDAYHKYTCIRFQPKAPGDVDYIQIQNRDHGCYSSIGRIGGPQTVNLQSPGCFSQIGTTMHELLHVVGFMHEQNRADRDDYVDIIYNNLQPNTQINFKKMDADYIGGFGVTYDYNSVMHYSANAFSANGKPTIISKNNKKNIIMGQRKGFSQGDIKKIRNMYKCTERDEESNNKTNKNNTNIFAGLISSFFG